MATTSAGGTGKATTGLFRVIGLVDEPGNEYGDAYTKLEVVFNFDTDDYQNAVVSAVVTTTN